jgi:chromosome segregation ATPase
VVYQCIHVHFFVQVQARVRESAVKHALEQTTAALDISDNKCDALKYENAKLVFDIEAMRTEHVRTSALTQSELAQRQLTITELNDKLQALQHAQDTLHNEHTVTVGKLHNALLQVVQLTESLKDTRSELASSQSISTQLQQQLNDVTERLTDEQTVTQQLHLQCNSKDDTITEITAAHACAVSKLDASNSELSHTQSLLLTATTELQATRAEVVDLNSQLQQSAAVISEVTTAKNTVCHELKTAQDVLAKVNAKYAADTVKHECAVQSYEQQISQLQAELVDKTSLLSQLTEVSAAGA